MLEVGCGRGDTIRQLVKLLEGIPGARLVAVEISDAHFAGFFDRRLERLAAVVPNDTLRAGFQEWAGEMHRKAVAAGGMESHIIDWKRERVGVDQADIGWLDWNKRYTSLCGAGVVSYGI